jgi:protein-tyrosine phosphatase
VKDRDPTSLVDLHSHLVPGVDDGARDLRATLSSVERMTRVGIRKIVTTPHIDARLTLDAGSLEARLAEVTDAWELAAEAIRESFPEVQFRRGHEVMIDVPDPDFSDPRIRLAETSFVLVEWPRLNLPPATAQVLERIVRQGYRPIVAHPERYFGMGQSLPLAAKWRESGAFLQVNYGSLIGRYGAEARTTAFRLLRRGWVDYLSSDFHGHARLKIYKKEAWSCLEQLDGEECLAALCIVNPGRLLDDEKPLPVPPLPADRGFWTRLKDILSAEMS